MKTMNVLIYGGGAVGLGIASCLMKSNQEVTILGRPKSINLLNQRGLTRTGIFGSLTAPPGSFSGVTALEEISTGPFDCILVAIKSYDSEMAARDIRDHSHLFSSATSLVLFQNGWGNAEIFARYFDRKMVNNARVITGFICPEPNHVDITVHADAIHIGSLFSRNPERLSSLCQAIAAGGIPCEPTDNIGADLWAKMLFNCPLNSLGAVCGVPYGTLGANRWSRNSMERIVSEIFHVMNAAGYAVAWESPDQYIDFFYSTLIPRTAEHFSSTLQDLRAGKPTEIDALNGAVVRMATELRIEVPANETLYNLIKFIEENQSAAKDCRTRETRNEKSASRRF